MSSSLSAAGFKSKPTPQISQIFSYFSKKSLQIAHQLPATVSRAPRGVRGAAPSKDTSRWGRDRDKYRCDFKLEQFGPAGIPASGGLLQRGFLEKLGAGWEFTAQNPNGAN